ncbi:uncharacterized protein EKO05_0009150 [Ascochyta rabiei]|uniref:Uncharacterized protein n=1 Tax=Didymella rabiei TaxID=5454 RepID=A0A163IQ64_DIDRA|nr:uncharacterized protein EKO05_0009150 [Ascochyta rabiei]KZM25878.1 hypothetical protein ST47_g2940 [Ascochyta rabiei]UPX18866.1 hypothetical protein EKO05_0009150 [Ascochyta rabiei]
MAVDIETLDSIRTWAQAGFPDSFAKLDGLTSSDMTVRLRLTGRVMNSIRVTKEELLITIPVGSLAGPYLARVYAWTERNGSVSLGHAAGGYMEVHRDTTNPPVHFHTPYCLVGPVEDETGAARFEALIRYCVSIKRVKGTGIRSKTSAFKEHFPGACCEVAEQVTREAREKRIADRCVRLELPHKTHLTTAQSPASTPTPTPTAATAPTAPTTLETGYISHRSEPPTPTAVANEHPQSLDQAFATFKTTLTTQINAARVIDTHEKAALTIRVHSLELSVASAEAERDKLQSDLLAAKEEAEKWKAQYEGLKKVLWDTVEREF